MLNALLKRMNGSSADATALAQALEAVGGERETAIRELEELRVRRHQMLLDDVSDQVLDKTEREIARAEVRIEKLDAALPDLRARLTAAQAEARRQRIAEFCAAYFASARQSLPEARACLTRFRGMSGIREAARAAGFEHEVALWPTPPALQSGAHVLSEDVLDLFEASLTPPQPAARPAPPAVISPTASAAAKPTRARTATAAPAPRPPPQPSAADDLGPLEEGNLRVVAVRPGFQNHRGERCRAGWRGQMPRAIAEAAARGGAVEIIAETAVTEPKANEGGAAARGELL